MDDRAECMLHGGDGGCEMFDEILSGLRNQPGDGMWRSLWPVEHGEQTVRRRGY